MVPQVKTYQKQCQLLRAAVAKKTSETVELWRKLAKADSKHADSAQMYEKKINALHKKLGYEIDEQDRLQRMNVGLREQLKGFRQCKYCYDGPGRARKSQWSP